MEEGVHAARIVVDIARAIEQGINDWSPEDCDCTMDEHAAKFVMTEVVLPLLADKPVDEREIIEVAPALREQPGTVPIDLTER